MLAAGALLTPGKTLPGGQVWAGNPAKYWRDIGDKDRALFPLRAGQYAELGQIFRKEAKERE